MVMLNDVPLGLIWPNFQFTTAAQGQNSTASANQITPVGNAGLVIMNCTTGTPGTYTVRTAAQMVADGNLYLNQQWLLLLVNGQGTGTITFTGAAGVTLVGTNVASIAASSARLYQCQVTAFSTPAITFTSVFSFTATALAYGAA